MSGVTLLCRLFVPAMFLSSGISFAETNSGTKYRLAAGGMGLPMVGLEGVVNAEIVWPSPRVTTIASASTMLYGEGLGQWSWYALGSRWFVADNFFLVVGPAVGYGKQHLYDGFMGRVVTLGGEVRLGERSQIGHSAFFVDAEWIGVYKAMRILSCEVKGMPTGASPSAEDDRERKRVAFCDSNSSEYPGTTPIIVRFLLGYEF